MQDDELRQRLLSRPDVQQIYGISKRFLEIAAIKGDGPSIVKVGRLARYRRDDIEAWIESRVVASTSEKLK